MGIDDNPIESINYQNVTKIYIPDSVITRNPVFNINCSQLLNLKHIYIGVRILDKISTLFSVFHNCHNLIGRPMCGPNVIDMTNAYYNCIKLTGQPACKHSVIYMNDAYYNCRSLTGYPVCGENVNMFQRTYLNCYNLSGSPVCGNNVKKMDLVYGNCYNLTGNPVCGTNVTHMNGAYANCNNLSGNMYMYSDEVYYMINCFQGKDKNKMLNIFVNKGSSSYRTLTTATSDIVGEALEWEQDENDTCRFNTKYNIYIYPVDNVSAIEPYRYNRSTMRNED